MISIFLLFKHVDLFKNRILTLIIFVGCTFLLNTTILGQGFIIPIVSFFNRMFHSDLFNHYYLAADFFLSGERILPTSEIEIYATIHKYRMFITHLFILYYGFKVKDRYSYGSFFYNMTAISIIIFQISQGFELLDRFQSIMYMFVAFILTYIIRENRRNRLSKDRNIINAFILFSVVNLYFRLLMSSWAFKHFNTYILDF